MAESRFAITPQVAQLIRNGQQAMYNCNFETANRDFTALIGLYPDHPAGYMYQAACFWWRCLGDSTNQGLQGQFLQSSEAGIMRGEAMVKADPKNFYAQMFLAGIYGIQAQFYVTITHDYWAAIRAGRKGDKHNRAALAFRADCVDCRIGTGSRYYAPEVIPPILRHMAVLLGARGNKLKSLKDLELAAEKGEFAQTEAKIVLLGIYYNEGWFEKYEELLHSLIDQYPSNHIFYMWLSDYYIQQHRYDEGTRFFSDLLKRVDGDRPANVSSSYAYLEKGRLELEKRLPDEAITSISKGMEAGRDDQGFMAQAHLLRGFALDLLRRRNSAVQEYQAVLAFPNFEETHKSASHFSKVPFQGKL